MYDDAHPSPWYPKYIFGGPRPPCDFCFFLNAKMRSVHGKSVPFEKASEEFSRFKNNFYVLRDFNLSRKVCSLRPRWFLAGCVKMLKLAKMVSMGVPMTVGRCHLSANSSKTGAIKKEFANDTLWFVFVCIFLQNGLRMDAFLLRTTPATRKKITF